MKLKHTALFVWVIACPLPSQSISAANVVIGNCNNIITLNFGDRQAVLNAIRAEYPSADLTNIDVIVEIAGCQDQITDPKRRAGLLIFALNEMILIKEKRFLPAIDAYIAIPTDENFAQMIAISHKAVRKIDSAIDTLLSYEASVATAATLSPSRLAFDQNRLAEAQLQSRLQAQLTQPLRELESIHNRALATQDAMIQFRNQYAAILEDIKETLKQMIDELRQGTASNLLGSGTLVYLEGRPFPSGEGREQTQPARPGAGTCQIRSVEFWNVRVSEFGCGAVVAPAVRAGGGFHRERSGSGGSAANS
jgi:hypothetical protein